MTINKTKKFFLLFISIIFCCCSTEIWHSDFKDFSNGWKASDTATFNFNEIPNSKGSIFINLRNDNNYPFSNIFLITILLKDGIEMSSDNLEYSMADKSGRCLGKGFGNVKESLFYWKEDISFSSDSEYSVILRHAMRKSQNESGMKILPGIISIGISIMPNR